MINKHFKADKVREIHFYNDNTEIPASSLFESIYSNLDTLISYNRDELGCRRGIYEVGIGSKETRNNILGEALKRIKRSSKPMDAKIIFDDNSILKSDIKPRTNFYNSLMKRPNIIYLEGPNTNHLIIREAREYSSDKFVEKRAAKIFGKHYKKNFELEDLLNGQRQLEHGDIILIPEPNLLCALESVCEQGVERITPNIKLVGVNRNSLWYLRDFLPSLRDNHLIVTSLMEYSGILNGLGLMDRMDSQSAHYCISLGRRVVNIDPDFFTYTPNPKTIDNLDWRDFKEIVENDFLVAGILPREYHKTRRKIMGEVNQKMDGKIILDFLPKDGLSSCKVLKKHAIDNASFE